MKFGIQRKPFWRRNQKASLSESICMSASLEQVVVMTDLASSAVLHFLTRLSSGVQAASNPCGGWNS